MTLPRLARTWPGDLIALMAGALLPLAFAPFSIGFLSLLAPALLLWCWQTADRRRCVLRGGLFGVGLFGVGASWVFVSIHVYGQASVILAALLTALFVLGLALLFAAQGFLFACLRSHGRSDALLLFPALWVLLEAFRGWFLTGFPWLHLGTPHVDSWLGGWAPFLGVLALSGFSALTAGLLVQILNEGRRFWLPAAAVIGLVWLGGWGLLQIRWTQDEPLMSVALVQGNVPQQRKWEPDFLQETLERYQRLSEPHWQHDLLIWPEAAIPAFADAVKPWLQAQDQHARQHGSTLMTGIPTRSPDAEGRPQYRNSLLSLGASAGRYDKHQLVPFGEYVPLENWLRGLIAFFDLPMSGFSAGPGWQPPMQAGDYSAAPLICYEIAYPDYTARLAQAAQFIVTVSNDTWFGRSIGPHQHLQIARLRALETSKPVLRATNDGFTALIDHHGRITAQAERFVETVLTGQVTPQRGQTLFSVWGSWPVIILCSLLLTQLFWQHTRKNSGISRHRMA